MNDANNLPIKASSIPPVTAISKTTPYGAIKQQKNKHYPGEVTKALLSTLIATETLTYRPASNMQHKILGKIIYRQA